MFNKPVAIIRKILPSEVVKWGKVRIGDSGDAIRGKNILPLDVCDNSFIKASIPITQCHVIENNVTSTPVWELGLPVDCHFVSLHWLEIEKNQKTFIY